jgi:hypothetical protein
MKTDFMDELKKEIYRTKSEIEATQELLDRMIQDNKTPLWKLIETNRALKDLGAYLKGLECQTYDTEWNINRI